jgi:hypothetical protein
MSKIALASNPSGTGTFTLASPATNTDRTLTLPDVTTTLVGTDATQTLTNKSIAGSQLTGSVASSLLTGALPAIDGSALTGIVTGGMTLLGTIATTSGATATLSGLTLTSYQQVVAVVRGVSATVTNGMTFSSLQINTGCLNTQGVWGILTVDLTAGTFAFNNTVFAVSETNNVTAATTYHVGVQNTLTTSSTSISFGSGGGTFDAGSIRIYGVK